MPHIHTEPGQHDLTTTAFILRTDGAEPSGLLHQHRKLGLLLPVGGHVELLENPWAAAMHEIVEESGYDMSQLKVLQPKERVKRMTGTKVHPVPLFLQTHEFKSQSDHYHVDVGFCLVANEPPQSLPVEGESQELLWLTRAEIADRRNEMPADIHEIYEFCFATALEQWEAVDPDTFDA